MKLVIIDNDVHFQSKNPASKEKIIDSNRVNIIMKKCSLNVLITAKFICKPISIPNRYIPVLSQYLGNPFEEIDFFIQSGRIKDRQAAVNSVPITHPIEKPVKESNSPPIQLTKINKIL